MSLKLSIAVLTTSIVFAVSVVLAMQQPHDYNNEHAGFKEQVLRDSHTKTSRDGSGSPDALRAPFAQPQQQLTDDNQFFTQVELSIWQSMRCGACREVVRDTLLPALSGVQGDRQRRLGIAVDEAELQNERRIDAAQKQNDGGDDAAAAAAEQQSLCPDYGMEQHEMLLFCRKVASHYAGLCIEDVRKGCGAVQAEVDRRRERGDDLARELTMHEAHTLCMDMGMCGKLGMYGRG